VAGKLSKEAREMKSYLLSYQVEIEAEDIDSAEKLAEEFEDELKSKARLVAIRAKEEEEFLDISYGKEGIFKIKLE
jgi:hypothetical protein